MVLIISSVVILYNIKHLTLFSYSFIYEWICRHGDCDVEVARTELGVVELCDPNQKCLAQCMQQIGDDIDEDVELRQ